MAALSSTAGQSVPSRSIGRLPVAPVSRDLRAVDPVATLQSPHVNPGLLQGRVDVLAQFFAFPGLITDGACIPLPLVDLVQGEHDTPDGAQDVLIRGRRECSELTLERG